MALSWISGNRYLSISEMQNNAHIITAFFGLRGWTPNAIAGLLGNMQSESTINPGIWESLNEDNISGGFGLVQWTPASKYIDWVSDTVYPLEDGFGQLIWIDEETVPSGQWVQTDDYPITFEEFKTSTETPEYLASAFLKNFERAGVEVEEERRTQASYWYSYINSLPDIDFPDVPSEPDEPITPSKKKRKKFNFILFNRQRRTML